MYAVIKTGGKQYRIQEGDHILIDRSEGDKKGKIKFNEVLLIKDDGKLITEVKDLSKAMVIGSVLEHLKGKKVIVFKYKPKKNYRRKKGHRSLLTKVKIEEISYEGKKKKVVKVKEEKETPPKPKAVKKEIKPLKAKEVRKPEKKEEKGKPAEAEVKGSVGLYARRKKKEEEPKKQAKKEKPEKKEKKAKEKPKKQVKKEKPEKKESKLRKRISRKKSEEKIKPKEKTTKARKKESTKE